jgi:hypothetical protein
MKKVCRHILSTTYTPKRGEKIELIKVPLGRNLAHKSNIHNAFEYGGSIF